MMNRNADPSPSGSARVAGAWYALLTVFSIFGIVYADSRFYVAGDAATTMGRILSDEGLFRLGIASNLAGQVCQVFLGLALFRLFEPVDRDRARTVLGLAVAMVPVAFLFRLGYHFEFFKNRVYLEPSVAFNYWPIDTNFPASFSAIENKWPDYFLLEPGLNFGIKF